ncbi:MAG TPA: Mini-circle protein [Micromonosporaceae bacterium]|nr:Mini-circle protein [Micromonosporaceae bacterium]
MTWIAPDVERVKTPYLASEREMLEVWLDHHRQTLLLKCAGLSAEQLKTPSVEPSTLTLLGLVRHMAEVERGWFRINFAGEKIPHLFCTEESPDGDFDDIESADAEADFAAFQDEIELADSAAKGRSLEDTFTHPRRQAEMNLRWIYVHMIEEYARHNGHADFLRERIDGVTGA